MAALYADNDDAARYRDAAWTAQPPTSYLTASEEPDGDGHARRGTVAWVRAKQRELERIRLALGVPAAEQRHAALLTTAADDQALTNVARIVA